MMLFAAESVFIALAESAPTSAASRGWQQLRFAILSLSPAAWLLFSASYARADLPPLHAARRNFIWLLALAPVVLAIVFRADLFAPPAPGATSPVVALGWAGTLICSCVLLGAVLTVLNLERTFRASIGTMRWRIKFMLLGVGVIFVTRIYTSTQNLVFHALDSSRDMINAGALLVATPLIVRSILRAGHFELAVYPSQAVLRNSVTVVVSGLYLVLTGFLAHAVSRIGGDEAFALKAFLILVALVALAIALQSDRAQLRLRQFVSRHFQRPLHDYRTVWQKFTAATASRVDAPALSRAVATLTADVFQALSVSVWLLNNRRDAFVLSTSTSPCGAGNRPTSLAVAEIAPRMQADPSPREIEWSAEPWAAALRAAHPSIFPHGGRRVCVPLVSRGEVLGLILIGDRVGGLPLGEQDLEMLGCIADHVAASLMNLQLAQRLAEARELEAFQAMAAFFVHDLKNAASTLSLMLRNLPVHFDNPEFRADALRGIEKTVTHINGLIGRLTALRRELKVELAEADLNEVVETALAGLSRQAAAPVEKLVTPLPRIPLDRNQLDKVVTNLVLNATEAVNHEGRIRVATGREDGWVVLTVADDGCGMTDDFLQHSLFRPFQTTKARGLGIGMFQSKMIVEAHGGRITVASRPGQGTTFRVFLPPAAAR